MADGIVDDKLVRSLRGQLRSIKWLLALFGLLIILMLAILGFVAYQVVSFTDQTERKINDIQRTTEQKLDLKSQLCDNPDGSYLTAQFCQE